MLGFTWFWDNAPCKFSGDAAHRLGKSLCSGLGGAAASVELNGLHFAYRPLRPNPVLSKAWRPALLSSGRIAGFHGYFDNLDEITKQLGLVSKDLAFVYGEAVDHWGNEADLRIVGEYCAIVTDVANQTLRLSRSPLRAPPLHYSCEDHQVAASSVPRALFAVGVARELNEDRVVDSALINYTDEESTWFKGISRVPLGSVVDLKRGSPRELRCYYDLGAFPDIQMDSDADYIARANELLDEGIRAALAGSRLPGTTLSSGLDSPQIAVRSLKHIALGQKLPTFTFHPEKEWDGIVQVGMNGNERPFVEAFAEMHPGLELHFTDNEGYSHDHRWSEFFHLMGGAPSGLCNMYVFHGVWSLARKRGCDLLLLAEWGNYTFSDTGQWGFVEYFITGRWRQLWRALRNNRNDHRTTLRRFIALSLVPLLPDPLWKRLMRLWHPKKSSALDLISPLRREFKQSSGADERLKRSGITFDRYQPWNRRHAQRLLFRNSDGEGAEIYQAFEQLYGVPQRDPMAYRPFVEFCFGLPVRMFLRDGQMRWLAKEMGRGIMPEEQRKNELNGRWDSDWHLRIGRQRKEYLSELDRIESDERLSNMLDVARLRAALLNFPESTVVDNQTSIPLEMALPRGILTARFINYVEGRNEI